MQAGWKLFHSDRQNDTPMEAENNDLILDLDGLLHALETSISLIQSESADEVAEESDGGDDALYRLQFLKHASERRSYDTVETLIEDLHEYARTDKDPHRRSCLLDKLEVRLKDLPRPQLVALWKLHTTHNVFECHSIMTEMYTVTINRAPELSASDLGVIITACMHRGETRLRNVCFNLVKTISQKGAIVMDAGDAASCLETGWRSRKPLPEYFLQALQHCIEAGFDKMTLGELCQSYIVFHSIGCPVQYELCARMQSHLLQNFQSLTPRDFIEFEMCVARYTHNETLGPHSGIICEYMDRNIATMEPHDAVSVVALVARFRQRPSESTLQTLKTRVFDFLHDLNSTDYSRIAWALCKLNIFVGKAVFSHTLMAPAPQMLQDMDCKSLCDFAYAVSVLCAHGHDMRQICSDLQTYVLRIPINNFNRSQYSILHQFILSLRACGYNILFSENFQQYCASHFATRPVQPSEAQSRVAHYFRTRGFSVQEELFCEATKYSIDMQLSSETTGDKCLVEFNGPVHYVLDRNGEYNNESGSTLLKRWHLTICQRFPFATIKYNEVSSAVRNIASQNSDLISHPAGSRQTARS